MTSSMLRRLPAAAATALLVSVALTVAGHPPLRNPADGFGRALEPFPVAVGVGWSVLAAVGLLVAPRLPGTLPRLAALAPATLLVDQGLLAALGYLPYLLVRAALEDAGPLDMLLSPGLALQAVVVAGVVTVVLRTPVHLADPARSARRWTRVAIEAPLVYAVSRVLMFLQAPGFSDPSFDHEVRVAGLGLGLAAVAGALLTTSLSARWGEWFPTSLVAVPAVTVAVMVVAASRVVAAQVLAPGATVAEMLLAHPLVLLPHLLWPLWGVALAMAALAHRQRRQQRADAAVGAPAV